MKNSVVRWALKWCSKNNADYIIYDNCLPKFFLTRKEARKYANKKYGYIKTRIDLRQEPHNWRIPRAIKVKITIQEI